MIPISASDKKAIGLVERLMEIKKRQLPCMKAQCNKNFNLNNSIRAIIHIYTRNIQSKSYKSYTL